jgi:antiviral helicase SKI2
MSAMNSTIEQLSSIADDFVEENVIPEVDWTKMRSIEFQDALKSRRNLVKQQKRIDCTPYEHFDAQVSYSPKNRAIITDREPTT